jgi:hypothetical protein
VPWPRALKQVLLVPSPSYWSLRIPSVPIRVELFAMPPVESSMVFPQPNLPGAPHCRTDRHTSTRLGVHSELSWSSRKEREPCLHYSISTPMRKARPRAGLLPPIYPLLDKEGAINIVPSSSDPHNGRSFRLYCPLIKGGTLSKAGPLLL